MVFINEAIHKAITDYQNSKDKPDGILYNSFLVVVIRMLVYIYGELDIINPFITNNESAFDDNLSKYGYELSKIQEFKRLLDGYYLVEKKNMKSLRKEENIYFVEVQKRLIDMFNEKRLNFGIVAREQREFFDLLYTPGCSNALRISYNYLNASDVYEVAKYYKSQMELNSNKKEDEEEKELLPFDVYKLFNINTYELSKMNNDDVNKLNKQIFNSLNINANAVNKDYLLSEKLKEFRREQNPITTGNGYVDILVIMSIIVTCIMVISIFGILVF